MSAATEQSTELQASEISRNLKKEKNGVLRFVGGVVVAYILAALLICGLVPSSQGISESPELAFDQQ
eukprot:scaffold411584_cov27-Prasinocladus_malaysianus.AAC.1